MILFAFDGPVYDCLLSKPFVPAAEWAQSELMMPPESKLKGNYRLDYFPHFVEPFQCLDDPNIERITIQTAAQIGKTMWSLACLAKVGATNPHPMAFADADERSTKRVIRRAWKLFERCPGLSDICPPKRMQAGDNMLLKTFQVHGAWAGSAASAADYGAFLVVLNECDKMKQRSTDTEADFRWLMGERTKGYVGAKVLELSTPSLTGGSYVEAQRLKGDNRRRMVPCPFCNHFQELITGNPKEGPGGIRFERNADGELDPQIARDTAYYECEKCLGKIEEHHRYKMLNAGLWVPEGCEVKKGKVIGQPTRPGRHASFGPVSTLHSLLPGVTIGVYAENFVSAMKAKENKRKAIQNFTNSWEGKTFDPRPVRVKVSDLVDRMGCDLPLRVCPEWSTFLTLAADLGRVGDTMLFYWWVSAWGPFGRGQLLDLGVSWGDDAMIIKIAEMIYPHADGGEPLRPIEAGFDSGSFTNSTYEFCKPLPNTWPVKGSSRDEDSPFTSGDFIEMYRGGFQRSGIPVAEVKARQRTGNYDLIIVNTSLSQEWIEDRITGLVKPTDANWYSIPKEAFDGGVGEINLAHHLLGDVQNAAGGWDKRYNDQDFRDAFRYSMVMAYHYTANGSSWNRLTSRSYRKPEVKERAGFVRKGKIRGR